MSYYKKFIWPSVFVTLWSTGPIATKFALMDATPFALLSLRSFSATFILFFISKLYSSRKYTLSQILKSIFVGVLIHSAYLGTAFYAIDHGVNASLSALLTSTQPVFTAALAFIFLNESLKGKRLGLFLGVFGVFIFIVALRGYDTFDTPISMTLLHLFGVICLSIGLIIQKSINIETNFIDSTLYQYVGATIIFFVLTLTLEEAHLNFTINFIFSFVWLTIVLSVVSTLLLMYLINKNESITNLSSLFYLMPIITALLSIVTLGEELRAFQVLGILVTVFGVMLVQRSINNTS